MNRNCSTVALKGKIVIGIFGISGAGKSTLLNELKVSGKIPSDEFIEESNIIHHVTNGGTEEFRRLSSVEKAHHRLLAAKELSSRISCCSLAVIVGHYSFPLEESARASLNSCPEFVPVLTDADFSLFTHIIYLRPSAIDVYKQRLTDSCERPELPTQILDAWMKFERDGLRTECIMRGIFFCELLVRRDESRIERVTYLIRDFMAHSGKNNISHVLNKIENVLSSVHPLGMSPYMTKCDENLTCIGNTYESNHCSEASLSSNGYLSYDDTSKSASSFHVTNSQKDSGTILLIDGDRTLCLNGTTQNVWDVLDPEGLNQMFPLKNIFRAMGGYSYKSFRQVTMLYEAFPEAEYINACAIAAQKTEIHSEWINFFKSMYQTGFLMSKTRVFLITSGLKMLWEKILQKYDLSWISVIGGGRITDGFVVDKEVKNYVAVYLSEICNFNVWSFGESALDISMLLSSNRGFLMVGDESIRSKSVDSELNSALKKLKEVCELNQILLPKSVNPSKCQLPITTLNIVLKDLAKLILRNNPELVNENINYKTLPDVNISTAVNAEVLENQLSVCHFTDNPAARILASLSRDASMSGPKLREIHRNIGVFLAYELLKMIGIEEFDYQHVHGSINKGCRAKFEEKTLIVALMRGGEPIALGVNEALPLAAFLHAVDSDSIVPCILKGRRRIILVDSVINNGRSIIQHLKKIDDILTHENESIDIHVLTGVMQSKSLGGVLNNIRYVCGREVTYHALRLSDNKYTGQGGTDTGNRLFNTTYI